jgi:hypothetical protein
MARRAPSRQPELFPGPTDLEGYQPPVGGHHRAHTAPEVAKLDAALALATEILAQSRAMVQEIRNRRPTPDLEPDE